jgi:sec-independent protein translocase protein TatA
MFRNPLIDAAVVLIIVLLFFGPKRLPELGKGLGHGMREFKEGITGRSKNEEPDQAALSSADAPAPSGGEAASGQNRQSAEVGSERPS